MKPEAKSYYETWQVSRFWAVSKFKSKTDRGPCYPLRITWDSPVTRDYVLNYCRQQAAAGDKDFKGFKNFDCNPFTPL